MKSKNFQEVRDPIHVFIKYDCQERKLIDSIPFQRLRHIHQLALTYLLYPGATHKRFGHSLGVMELAGRVYDVITTPENIHEDIRHIIPTSTDELSYWRRVLRVAALCHDLGHLPFSHATEHSLIDGGWNHERLTREFIQNSCIREKTDNMTPPLKTEHIVKLALGKKEAKDLPFSDWEAILSEIITGDAFGVDRMDYLLRDSHHAGVLYGKFDHLRLIDTLRILPLSVEGSTEPYLGIEKGGLHCAEALLMARYFMFKQLYLHPVRRIYDIHLRDFLSGWLTDGRFPNVIDKFVEWTDNKVFAGFVEVYGNKSHPSFNAARRIVERNHFRLIYELNPKDRDMCPDATDKLFNSLSRYCGAENVKKDTYVQPGGLLNFPVVGYDNRISQSTDLSETLARMPRAEMAFIFISPEKRDKAEKWLDSERDRILDSSSKEIAV
ncbi:MAG: HD domain-containing protein [candidate division Zixibacteria bacterium]|nr:HD domain-containing protein [candidate division Zixibacteria bacterium]